MNSNNRSSSRVQCGEAFLKNAFRLVRKLHPCFERTHLQHRRCNANAFLYVRIANDCEVIPQFTRCDYTATEKQLERFTASVLGRSPETSPDVVSVVLPACVDECEVWLCEGVRSNPAHEEPLRTTLGENCLRLKRGEQRGLPITAVFVSSN